MTTAAAIPLRGKRQTTQKVVSSSLSSSNDSTIVSSPSKSSHRSGDVSTSSSQLANLTTLYQPTERRRSGQLPTQYHPNSPNLNNVTDIAFNQDPIPIPIPVSNSSSPWNMSSPKHASAPRKAASMRCPHCGMLRRPDQPFTKRGSSPPRSHPSLLFQSENQLHINGNSHSPVEHCCDQDVFFPDISMPDDDIVITRNDRRRESGMGITESPLSRYKR